jgi:Trk K+ transport system NAD-binding subunit
VGMNAMGRRLVNDLYERGETVLAIDTDARKLEDLPCHQLVGNINYPSVLADASLERAKLVVSTLRIEDTNNLLAYHSKKAGVPAAIHAFDPSVKNDLRRLDVDFLIDPKKSWLDEVIAQIGQTLPGKEKPERAS